MCYNSLILLRDCSSQHNSVAVTEQSAFQELEPANFSNVHSTLYMYISHPSNNYIYSMDQINSQIESLSIDNSNMVLHGLRYSNHDPFFSICSLFG